MRFKPLVSHLEIDQKLDTVKEGLDAHFRGFSVKKDCMADKNELLHRIGDLVDRLNDQSRDLDTIIKGVKSIESVLPNKAESEDVLYIRDLMDEMPKRTEVQQVRTDLFGSMLQFTEDNN